MLEMEHGGIDNKQFRRLDLMSGVRDRWNAVAESDNAVMRM